MKYTIEEVLNEKQAKEFLLLPVSLYKNDENWVCLLYTSDAADD